MKTPIKITAFLVVALASLPAVKAQRDSNVYNARVVVTSRYRPVVEETQKINVAPTITDTVATMPKSFTYDISTRRLTSLYEPSRIKAARIIGEPATRLYNNYMKLGFGNYLSPLAEVYFNSLRNDNKTYGIRATHSSSWGTIGKSDPEKPSADYYGQAPFSSHGSIASSVGCFLSFSERVSGMSISGHVMPSEGSSKRRPLSADGQYRLSHL